MPKANDWKWSEQDIKSVSDRIRKVEEAVKANTAAKRALTKENVADGDKVADKYDVYERIRGC